MKKTVVASLKRRAYIPFVLEELPPMVDVAIAHNAFDRESSTDISYYVPSAEMNKNLDKMGANKGCLYDNGNVSDVVADMRRPGNDMVELELMADGIVRECKAEYEFNMDKQSKAMAEHSKNMAESIKKDAFVTGLMQNDNSVDKK